MVKKSELAKMIADRDQKIATQYNTICSLSAENSDIRQAAERMLQSIGSLKQALRLAGETIKTVADGVPTK